MKFFVSTLLTALLAFAGGLFFPWWMIAVTSFVVGVLVHQRPGLAFVAGFLGVFLLWGVLSFVIDLQNHHLLATKVAAILPLGGSAIILIIVTAFIGGLVSGFASMTGSFLRKPIDKTDDRESESIYS